MLISSLLLLAAAAPSPPPSDRSGDDREVLIVAPREPLTFAAEPGTTVEAALGGGPLQPLDGPLEAPSEGDHWLAVAGRDAAGNLSAIRWVLLRIDGTPPRLELALEPDAIEGDAGGRWLPPGARGRLRAEDAPAGVAWVALTTGDPAAGEAPDRTEGSEIGVELPVRGDVRLSGWAEDRVGNRSAVEVLLAAVDADPPACRIFPRGPALETAATTVLGPGAGLETATEDAGSGVAQRRFFLDGVLTSAAGFEEVRSPGPHRAELVVTDRVGNTGRCERAFLVDVEPPRLRWRAEGAAAVTAGGKTVYRPPLSVEVTAEDDSGVARLEWSEDGESFTPVGATLTTTHGSLRFRAVDRVGNRSEVRAAWDLDSAPPVIRLRLPDGSVASPGEEPRIRFGESVDLVLEDTASGVASHRVWLNGSPLPPARAIEFESGGTHILEVEAVDGVGNRGRTVWSLDVRTGRR